MTQEAQELPELITLEILNLLPDAWTRSISPVSQLEAQIWAQKHQADAVYYWETTRTAYILL